MFRKKNIVSIFFYWPFHIFCFHYFAKAYNKSEKHLPRRIFSIFCLMMGHHFFIVFYFFWKFQNYSDHMCIWCHLSRKMFTNYCFCKYIMDFTKNEKKNDRFRNIRAFCTVYVKNMWFFNIVHNIWNSFFLEIQK